VVQCVAACCDVLQMVQCAVVQCVVVWCGVLQRVAMFCSVVHCAVVQCAVVCCGVLCAWFFVCRCEFIHIGLFHGRIRAVHGNIGLFCVYILLCSLLEIQGYFGDRQGSFAEI